MGFEEEVGAALRGSTHLQRLAPVALPALRPPLVVFDGLRHPAGPGWGLGIGKGQLDRLAAAHHPMGSAAGVTSRSRVQGRVAGQGVEAVGGGGSVFPAKR